MSSEILTVHVTCVGGPKIPQESQESIFRIPRAEMTTLMDKNLLANKVLVGTKFQFVPRNELVFERNSKKQKGFVILENAADFKEFFRSLKVKNIMKLVVRKTTLSDPDIEPPFQKAPTTLLVSEAGDQLRKLISEFQKSEIYDLLKSFSNLYKQAMAPDGCFTPPESSAELDTSDKQQVAADTRDHEIFGSRGLVHEGILCDQCESTDEKVFITGLRYKCMVCNDFDLCSTCYKTRTSSGPHSWQHAMIAIEDTAAYNQFRKCGGGHSAPSIFFSTDRKQPLQVIPPVVPQKRHNEKEEQEAKLVAEKAKKYEELERIVDEFVNDNMFEYLKEIVTAAVDNEMFLIQDRITEDLAKKDNEIAMALEAYEKFENEPETPVDRVFAEENCDSEITHFEPSLVEVAVVPKAKSLSQILIINKSENTIDCNGMSLNILNCFGTTVASVPIEKSKGIAPNRTSKFNVCISNTHFKHPFKIALTSSAFGGECLLSSKNMSGPVFLLPKAPLEKSADVVETASPLIKDSHMEDMSRHASGSSSASFATASVHSILLPLLPKEVLSLIAQEPDTAGDVRISEDEGEENEDYDLISVTEVEDLESDYELLSEAGSV